MRRVTLAVLSLLMLCVPAADAEDGAKSLDALLQQVRRGWETERLENQAREAEFRSAEARQAGLLEEARAILAAEEARSQELEQTFDDNELRLAQLEETLQERLGSLGEAFGVVRQVAGDTAGHVESSLVSAQLPGRAEFLEQLGRSKALPSIEALRKLWFSLQQEMTESGKVVRFLATVVTLEGKAVERDVVRVGTFNVLASGGYLRWNGETGTLGELGRQPGARHLATVAPFEAATGGIQPLSLDPSRGQLLSLLVAVPNAEERVQQGGVIGYAILALGAVAGLLVLVRLLETLVVSRKVSQQLKSETPGKNPLGRVLEVYENNRNADVETLGLKLDEAILRETARLDRFLWAVKVVTVVAPLMGLLGTVTGMIQTFQVITLYGTGDPKLMAGGISEALVTTMLGLCVAIPLVLLHALVTSGTKRIADVIDEQSAGLIAERAEQSRAAS